ncbi:MAG: hypothetical protein EPN97_09100 [Alphaproteobacteria bacterium]|nr:MAG: hypothetical protein EPN97_09100 [Alphaproteobacteria bacterium]
MSADFWDEWNKTKSSESYAAMKNAVGCADKNTVSLEAQHAAAKASKAPTKQTVVNMAIDRPEDAAALLNHAAESSKDKVSANALATVVNMVTSPKTREQAVPLMAPEAKPRVQEWAANLTTGIQGLPGIYLGDVQAPSYWSPEPPGGRSAMPSGYAPVSGGSFGCPTR